MDPLTGYGINGATTKPRICNFTSLENHVILSRIFSYLDLPPLKSARLVCSIWSDAGVVRLRTGKLLYLQLYPTGRQYLRFLRSRKMRRIPFKAPLTPKDVRFIQNFITNGRLPHKLRLSFQTFPWFMRENDFFYVSDLAEANKAGVIYTLEQPKDRGTLVLELLSNTGTWVTVLRLETRLVDEADAELLRAVLSRTTNLTKCYLDIVHWEDAGWLALPTTNLFPPSLSTLGLQLHESYVDAMNDQDTEVFSFPAATHFLAAVGGSNIQFLDFRKSNQHFNNMKARHKKLLITVIHSLLTQNPTSIPNLIGLKIELDTDDWWTEEANLFNTFPKSLLVLDLKIVQFLGTTRICTTNTIASILRRHSNTLVSLNLSWCDDVLFYRRPELPRLPALVSLEFSSGSEAGWTVDMLDFLNLRKIFLNGPEALRARLPSLTTLSYFLLDERDTEIWEHMFPPGYTFPQIQTLNISLATEVEKESDPCNSPVLTHFSNIFPQLRTLRHIKRVQNKDAEPVDWVCKHSLQNGVVVSIFNPWSNMHDNSRHNTYYSPIQHLLRDRRSDPFLYFDLP